MSAIDDIAAERKRQIDYEGFIAADDDAHVDESLAMVAALYAAPYRLFELTRDEHGDGTETVILEDPWPSSWDGGWDRRNDFDKRKRLVIAGALIAAEIDRIDRIAATDDGGDNG